MMDLMSPWVQKKHTTEERIHTAAYGIYNIIVQPM